MSELLHTYQDWKGPQVQDLVVPDLRARMALEIAKNVGMATAVEDAEDSTGRQKLRLLTPSEVANRAVDIANFMYARFDQLDWLGETPIMEDVKKDEGI
jgi:hypothetical protein